MKEDAFFSFRKESNRPQYQVKITDLLKCSVSDLIKGWYFVGHLLHSPETLIVDGQIRQIVKVCEPGNLQQTITVILTENTVRKYCNLLKLDHNFRFKNGQLKTEFFSRNYVIMHENSQICDLYFCEESEDDSFKEDQQKVRQVASVKPREGLETKSKKNSEINLALSNVVIKKSQRVDNGISVRIVGEQTYEESNPRQTKSQKIQNGKNTNRIVNEQFKSIVGRVLCRYIVGHEKAHHGTGYRIEQIQEKTQYQVVIWSQCTPIPPLLKGHTYEFKNFRVNNKPNYSISFHSHFLYSVIKEMPDPCD